MKVIKLTKGMVAIVDDEDFDWLSQNKWQAQRGRNGIWYAGRSVWSNGRGRRSLMHREILKVPKGRMTDHKDHNGLNNTRTNLRICSGSENEANKRLAPKTLTGFKGVEFLRSVTGINGGKKWSARIVDHGKKKYLGVFQTKEEAAQAYDSAARIAYGDFSLTNSTIKEHDTNRSLKS